MPKPPRSEQELKKISYRLIFVLAFVIYLLTPAGSTMYMALIHAVVKLFTHR